MNNLKPFDLQAALSGKAVMLRNGEKTFVRHHEAELSTEIDDTLLGYLKGVGSWSWSADGASCVSGDESKYDIIGMYPETRVINGFEVPAPETEELESGALYYMVTLDSVHFQSAYIWDYHELNKIWLKRGLVFLNKEDAIANAKAMLGIDPYEGD